MEGETITVRVTGPRGSGKSTIIREIERALSNRFCTSVEMCDEPVPIDTNEHNRRILSISDRGVLVSIKEDE